MYWQKVVPEEPDLCPGNASVCVSALTQFAYIVAWSVQVKKGWRWCSLYTSNNIDKGMSLFRSFKHYRIQQKWFKLMLYFSSNCNHSYYIFIPYWDGNCVNISMTRPIRQAPCDIEFCCNNRKTMFWIILRWLCVSKCSVVIRKFLIQSQLKAMVTDQGCKIYQIMIILLIVIPGCILHNIT